MNTLLLIIIGLPILEITLMIKIGQQIGAFNTIVIIFFTAIVGIYCAKVEGINTIKTGMTNLYKNKIPLYEIFSGASIALAAALLILPGFISDTIGFLLIIPFTRKVIINYWLKKNYKKRENTNDDVIDGVIVDEKKDKDEL
ncbi:FxsA family protein [Pelagibacteraceae bacterium]|nr:FxsA family protein [Pelagibacteraceae bacterium]